MAVKKVLILGKNGWVGRKLIEKFKFDGDSTRIEHIWHDTLHGYDIVINCIGMTGGRTMKGNVDGCEDHPEETYDLNLIFPFKLASICRDLKIQLIHIGSGCIYDGDNDGKGYDELVFPNFFGSLYSRTKIAAEQALRHGFLMNPTIVRIRMPFDAFPHHKSFLTKIFKYPKLINKHNSMTSFNTLYKFIAWATTTEHSIGGVWNVVDSGSISHKEIIKMYNKHSRKKLEKKKWVTEEELKLPAKRSNCVLDNTKLSRIINVKDVKEEMDKAIKDYVSLEEAIWKVNQSLTEN